MRIKGVLRVVRGAELKLSLPAPSITIKADGTIWYQGVPVLGAPEDKKAEMSKLVKAGKYSEIPSEYYARMGDNDNGLWVGDDEAWSKHPAKIAEDKKRAEKEIEDKKTVRIYLSSRGWGDYSSLEWVGDITRPDAEIIKECKELLLNGHDVDKANQSDTDILKLVQEAREAWATPSEEAEIEVEHGIGYCYSCETYCYGDCGDYQPEMTRKIMSNYARKEEHLDE